MSGMNNMPDDPIKRVAERIADLERELERAREEIASLVIEDARRGVPQTVLARRSGFSREAIRRWLTSAGVLTSASRRRKAGDEPRRRSP